MPNRFRYVVKRKTYDALMAAHRDKTEPLFQASGERITLNGFAGPFWKGYDGVKMNWDRQSRDSTAYICYCAGQDAWLRRSSAMPEDHALADLEVSVRLENCLKRYLKPKPVMLSDVATRTRLELLNTRAFGVVSYLELWRIMVACGFWQEDDPAYRLSPSVLARIEAKHIEQRARRRARYGS